ncbi:integrase, catalytic region, zinc finger, CCHC-type containing protein [Tanacetum coccineum]
MVQNVQGRWSQGDAGNARKNQASGVRTVNPVGNTGANQPRVIRCYNCNGEGHIAKQCTAKKRVNESLTSELQRYKDRFKMLEYASRDGCSEKEALLNRELRTVICDRNRKVKEMKDIFEQMKDEVDQCFVAKKSFEIEKKQLLINNDRLLEENIASDFMCTYLRSLNEVDNYGKCKSLDIVLLDLEESNKSLSELRRRFAKLEEYSIILYIAFQNHKKK